MKLPLSNVIAALLHGENPLAPAPRRNADSFENLSTGLGSSGDKARNVGVRLSAPLSFSQLDALQASSGYVRRWAMFPAEEMTRKGWTPTFRPLDPTNDGVSPKAAVAERLYASGEDLHLTDVAHEALWKARAHGASYVFVDIAGTESQALPIEGVVGMILRLHVLDARDVTAEVWDAFGVPVLYRVSPTRRSAYFAGMRDPFGFGSCLVHRDRLVCFIGEMLTHAQRATHWTEGHASVEHVRRAIENLSQTDDAGAVLAQEFKVDVLKTDLESSNTTDASAAFRERLSLIGLAKGVLNMIVTTKSEEFERHSLTLSGWKDLTEAQRASLAAQTGWPQSVLFGDAPQGMNTDSGSARVELNNWIATRQRRYLRRPLLRIYRLIARSVFGPFRGMPPAGTFDIKFRPLEELTLAQQSAVRLSTIQGLVALKGQGTMSADEVREHLDSWDVADEPFDFSLPGPAPIAPAPGAPTPGGGGTPGIERGPARALLGGRPDLTPDTTPQALDGGQGATGAAGGHVQKEGRGEGVEQTTPNADARDPQDPLAERFAIPDGAIANAREALRWREQNRAEANAAVTPTGWARARQIAAGGTIGRGDLVEVAAWFARHGTTPGGPAWLAWGGDAMATWAAERREALED